MELRILLDEYRDAALIEHFKRIKIRGGMAEEARSLMKTALILDAKGFNNTSLKQEIKGEKQVDLSPLKHADLETVVATETLSKNEEPTRENTPKKRKLKPSFMSNAINGLDS